MAYDEILAARVRDAIGPRADVTEMKMFGGLAFLQGGKMICGVLDSDLMVRVGAERSQSALLQEHVRPMDFTGRQMRGFVFVGPGGTQSVQAVERWVEEAATFVATLGTTSRKRGRKHGGNP